MTSLDDLLKTFGIQPSEAEKTAGETQPADDPERLASLLGGSTKTASPQGGEMSLADLFMSLEAQDGQVKEAADAAAAAAGAGGGGDAGGGGGDPATETDLEKAASAAAEADLEKDASIKLAAEYDAAGRIMARAFYEELHKLAASVESTHVTPGGIEPASQSKQEAVGPRGTQYQVPTNFAGSKGHDQPIGTAGSKQVNKDALKDKGAKSTSVGAGVTEQAAATPMFATVKNIMG
jgi:hypothetical protein